MRERPPKRRLVERALLGTLMGIAAFLIERRVRKALRGAGTRPGGEA